MVVRRVFLLLAAFAAATACGGSASDNGPVTPGTVPVGGLPSTLGPTTGTGEPTASTTIRTTLPISPEAQVGARVEGNRVIAIGDSVMASTSRRYSNDMCEALVPLGWQVEVDAETSRFIEFGDEVLDERLEAGWDVGVVLLGNNYNSDEAAYLLQLDRIIQRLSPSLVVLMTVSEFTESRLEVNEVIFDMAEKYDNVLIVDWGATTAADPTLVGGDGLHLTDKGRASLAEQVALALGMSPVKPGKCLPTEFDDDSAGNVDGGATTTTLRNTTRVTTTTSPDSTDPPDTDPPVTQTSTPAPSTAAPPTTGA